MQKARIHLLQASKNSVSPAYRNSKSIQPQMLATPPQKEFSALHLLAGRMLWECPVCSAECTDSVVLQEHVELHLDPCAGRGLVLIPVWVWTFCKPAFVFRKLQHWPKAGGAAAAGRGRPQEEGRGMAGEGALQEAAGDFCRTVLLDRSGHRVFWLGLLHKNICDDWMDRRFLVQPEGIQEFISGFWRWCCPVDFIKPGSSMCSSVKRLEWEYMEIK